MEILIRDKVKELLQTSMIDDVNDNVVVNIDNYIKDWDTKDQYPSIVVMCSSQELDSEAIQAKYYIYDCYIFVFNSLYEYDETEIQRNILKRRVLSTLQNNHLLDRLADNTNNEKIYDSGISGIDMDLDGQEGNFNGLCRIRLSVKTEKLKPF